MARFDTNMSNLAIDFQMKKRQNLNQYFQGLFHPARRVRECYWRIYNNLYLGAQVNIFILIFFSGNGILPGPGIFWPLILTFLWRTVKIQLLRWIFINFILGCDGSCISPCSRWRKESICSLWIRVSSLSEHVRPFICSWKSVPLF